MPDKEMENPTVISSAFINDPHLSGNYGMRYRRQLAPEAPMSIVHCCLEQKRSKEGEWLTIFALRLGMNSVVRPGGNRMIPLICVQNRSIDPASREAYRIRVEQVLVAPAMGSFHTLAKERSAHVYPRS